MSLQALGWGYAQKTGSGTRKAVLLALCNFADENGQSWPSVRRICRDTEFSERTVRETLRELEAAGFVSKEERRTEDGAMRSNLYTIHLPGRVHKPTPRGQEPQGTLAEGQGGSRCGSGGTPGVAPPEPSLRTSTRTEEAPLSSASLQKEEAPAGPDADPRKVLFDRGMKEFRKLTGMPEPKMRTLFGKWLRDAGDNALAVMRAIDEAAESEAADPVSFVAGRLKRAGMNGRPSWAQPGRYAV
jgi:DNA-binding transcriptional ArsR family regulator